MKKIVRYNGDKCSYYSCSNPDKLIVGKEYEVISEIDKGWQTDYILNGVEGHFNSVWFTVVNSGCTYMALSHNVPTVGDSCQCSVLSFDGSNLNLLNRLTSTVTDVSHIGSNIYYVTTLNSVYIIKVASDLF